MSPRRPSNSTVKRVLSNALASGFACLAILIAAPLVAGVGANALAFVAVALIVAAVVAFVTLPVYLVSELSARRKLGR